MKYLLSTILAVLAVAFCLLIFAAALQGVAYAANYLMGVF